MSGPNILIFMTDQQRGDTVPPYGRAITPNLDRLAREGLSFAQAFCPSPHCCPSRATFFTGLMPSEHGVWNNIDVGNALSRGPFPGTRYWSDDLRDAGYQLFYSGKWHVSALEDRSDRGWQKRFPQPRVPDELPNFAAPLMREWGRYKKLAPTSETQQRQQGEIVRPGYGIFTQYGESEGNRHDENVLADALDMIYNRPQSTQPWCQYVGMLGPHDPYFVPSKYLHLYPLEDIELPPTWHDKMLDKPGLYRKTRDRFDQLSEEEQRISLQHYLAYCTYEDELFGQVMQALEATGQLDNTLVMYLSDHGDYAGEHGLWAKGLPCFRGAYHIPMILRWPGGVHHPGRTEESFVTLADIAPTLLELAGVSVDRHMSGQSLMSFIRGEKPADWRDAVFTQSNGNELYGIQRSVMTKEWKYVYNGFDYDELYDLHNDPGETTNLARDPQYTDIVRMLVRRLWRYAYEHQDVCINSYIMVAHAPFGPAEAFRE